MRVRMPLWREPRRPTREVLPTLHGISRAARQASRITTRDVAGDRESDLALALRDGLPWQHKSSWSVVTVEWSIGVVSS